MEPNVDLILNGQAQGAVANHMASAGRLDAYSMRPYIGKDGKGYVTVYTGGNPKKRDSYKTYLAKDLNIRVNASTLRRDEWKQLDEAILKISDYRLGGIQDLVDKGLVYTLGNAMGTTVLEWHDVSDALEASLTMDGVTRSSGDRPQFQYNYLPIPIIHVDYEINSRVLEASRRLGNPLDTTFAERAARKVMEQLENMLFTNTTYSFGEKDERNRNTIYSYVNLPCRNQVTLSDNWDDSATTPRDIIEDVIAMRQASITDRHYGPWMLYIPTNYDSAMEEDYEDTGTTATGKTIRERIKQIDGILDIKVVDSLADDNVLLVQMTSDVVRLVRGMGLTNVEWKTEGQFVTKYKVMTIQVPQVRCDQAGRTGIVHLA